MKSLQVMTDKFAIGLSVACVIHCFALPLLLVLLPSAAALQLDNEAFHLWMVAAVLPSSLYALTMGCKKHKRYSLLLMGFAGLSLLVLALAMGEDRIGEAGEKTLTVAGAVCLALGHWFNYRLCRARDQQCCASPDENQIGI